MGGWKYEDCQIRCEQYQGCQAVDIQWLAVDDFDYKVSTCVLYDWNNMKAWEFCTQEKDWFACSHTGKRNSNVDKSEKAEEDAVAEKKPVAEAQANPVVDSSSDIPITKFDESNSPDWECESNLRCLKS